MLDSALLELSSISHMMDIEQETAQHLSRDSMFVVSGKMTNQIFLLLKSTNVFLYSKFGLMLSVGINQYFEITTLVDTLADSCLTEIYYQL